MNTTEEPKKKRIYTCVRCDKGSCREGFINDKKLCEKCDEETIHYELCWRKAMDEITNRSCVDVYKNIFVNSEERELRPSEEYLLNEIYLRSGGQSRNPFIFAFLAQVDVAFQP
jgi:hypothetical protein